MAEEAMVPAVAEVADLSSVVLVVAEVAKSMAATEVAAATIEEAKRRRGSQAKCKHGTEPRRCAQPDACL